MAVEVFKLFGSIFVNNDEANKSLAKTEEKAKSTHGTFASGVATVAKWGAAVGATALTVGSAAVKIASNYETSFAKVSTLLKGNESEISQYKKSIIAASNETGLASDEMSEAVYSAISAGVDQANAVSFTTDALKLAKGGFTETATAVDVLSTAINAYGLESDQASRISDILITTQNLGKTTVDELAGSMGKVIPLASAYGVNMENLGATYATLTAGGIATAEATTYTKSMMSELAKESSTVSSVLKDKTGKSFSELMNSGYSMGDVLQVLSDSVDGDSTAFANLWSSTEAGTGALAIVNSGADAFNDTLKSMQESSGATESAYGKMADTLEARVNKLKTNGQNMMTSLGESILPIVEDVCDEIIDNMPKIQSFIESLIPVFSEFFENILPPLVQIVETLMPVIMNLFEQIMPLIEELLPVISELMETLAPIIVQIVEQLFPPLLQIIQDLLPYFMQTIQAIMPLFVTLVELLMPVIEMFIQLSSVLLNGLLAALTPIIEDLATFLNDLLTPLIPIISELCDTIVGILQPVFEQLSPVISQVFDALRPVLNLLGEMLETLIPALVPVIEWLAKIFSEVLGNAIQNVKKIIEPLSKVFEGLVTFIKGVFAGDWEQAWQGIVEVFKNVFNLLPTFVENVINGIIWVINKLLEGVNWATSIIGWEIDPIPEVTLPRFRAGIDYVPHDKFAAYLDAGEAVLTAQEAEEYRQSKREGRGSAFENDSTNIVNNISINIPSVAINNDMDIDSFVDDMSNRLADEITRRQKAYA